ncbi:MAG: hypothetical protein M5U01_11285 [Ardenticatenaceae bacterium]|nr:hypothetical protein [Ardenticatenaceae bacterium]HBY96672.1 hypothetical protein [Chloroflexota bacterium]
MDILRIVAGSQGAGTWIAALLTLTVYTYLLGDNPLFRLAEHLLVAVSVGYAALVAYHIVLVPRLFAPLSTNAAAHPDLILPLVLGLFLLFKSLPAISSLGNPSLGYLLGIGLGLAVGGTLAGTLLPQSRATFLPLFPGGATDLAGAAGNIIIVVGTIATLLLFRFVRGFGTLPSEFEPEQHTRSASRVVGRAFLMITFGALFGGATLTYLSLLIGRWDFLINGWLRPILGL